MSTNTLRLIWPDSKFFAMKKNVQPPDVQSIDSLSKSYSSYRCIVAFYFLKKNIYNPRLIFPYQWRNILYLQILDVKLASKLDKKYYRLSLCTYEIFVVIRSNATHFGAQLLVLPIMIFSKIAVHIFFFLSSFKKLKSYINFPPARALLASAQTSDGSPGGD